MKYLGESMITDVNNGACLYNYIVILACAENEFIIFTCNIIEIHWDLLVYQ